MSYKKKKKTLLVYVLRQNMTLIYFKRCHYKLLSVKSAQTCILVSSLVCETVGKCFSL